MDEKLHNKIVKGTFSAVVFIVLALVAKYSELIPNLKEAGEFVALAFGLFAYEPLRKLVGEKFEAKFLKEEPKDEEEGKADQA